MSAYRKRADVAPEPDEDAVAESKAVRVPTDLTPDEARTWCEIYAAAVGGVGATSADGAFDRAYARKCADYAIWCLRRRVQKPEARSV